jgi:hypothetical protein
MLVVSLIPSPDFRVVGLFIVLDVLFDGDGAILAGAGDRLIPETGDGAILAGGGDRLIPETGDGAILAGAGDRLIPETGDGEAGV